MIEEDRIYKKMKTLMKMKMERLRKRKRLGKRRRRTRMKMKRKGVKSEDEKGGFQDLHRKR